MLILWFAENQSILTEVATMICQNDLLKTANAAFII